MNSGPKQRAFSLVEMLVAMAVIIILTALVLGVGRHLVHQSQERLTEGALQVLAAALEQFYEARQTFPEAPPGFGQADLENALRRGPQDRAGPDIQDAYASSELLYYRLDEVPGSRRLVEAVADSLKTDLDDQGRRRRFTVQATGEQIPLVRFVDAWGRSLRYVYEPGAMTFPIVSSAGIDGRFGTADDLTSEQ